MIILSPDNFRQNNEIGEIVIINQLMNIANTRLPRLACNYVSRINVTMNLSNPS